MKGSGYVRFYAFLDVCVKSLKTGFKVCKKIIFWVCLLNIIEQKIVEVLLNKVKFVFFDGAYILYRIMELNSFD